MCAQGGINGAVNTKGEGDSPEIHFIDSVKGGDFLANQPPVKAMCYAAPGVIYLLDRMGVPFTRTAEGLIDFRRFGGTLMHRTAFAGATTGQPRRASSSCTRSTSRSAATRWPARSAASSATSSSRWSRTTAAAPAASSPWTCRR